MPMGDVYLHYVAKNGTVGIPRSADILNESCSGPVVWELVYEMFVGNYLDSVRLPLEFS